MEVETSAVADAISAELLPFVRHTAVTLKTNVRDSLISFLFHVVVKNLLYLRHQIPQTYELLMKDHIDREIESKKSDRRRRRLVGGKRKKMLTFLKTSIELFKNTDSFIAQLYERYPEIPFQAAIIFGPSATRINDLFLLTIEPSEVQPAAVVEASRSRVDPEKIRRLCTRKIVRTLIRQCIDWKDSVPLSKIHILFRAPSGMAVPAGFLPKPRLTLKIPRAIKLHTRRLKRIKKRNERKARKVARVQVSTTVDEIDMPSKSSSSEDVAESAHLDVPHVRHLHISPFRGVTETDVSMRHLFVNESLWYSARLKPRGFAA